MLMEYIQGYAWEAEILETLFLTQVIFDGTMRLHRLGLRMLGLVLDVDRSGCERAPSSIHMCILAYFKELSGVVLGKISQCDVTRCVVQIM